MSHELSTTEELLVEMGRRLRQERLNRNISQQELAETAGTSVATIRDIEAGKANPTMRVVLGVLRALGLLGRFDALFPEPVPSPVQAAKQRKLLRQRASGASRPDHPEETGWRW